MVWNLFKPFVEMSRSLKSLASLTTPSETERTLFHKNGHPLRGLFANIRYLTVLLQVACLLEFMVDYVGCTNSFSLIILRRDR